MLEVYVQSSFGSENSMMQSAGLPYADSAWFRCTSSGALQLRQTGRHTMHLCRWHPTWHGMASRLSVLAVPSPHINACTELPLRDAACQGQTAHRAAQVTHMCSNSLPAESKLPVLSVALLRRTVSQRAADTVMALLPRMFVVTPQQTPVLFT